MQIRYEEIRGEHETNTKML